MFSVTKTNSQWGQIPFEILQFFDPNFVRISSRLSDCQSIDKIIFLNAFMIHIVMLLATLWNFALVSKQPYFHFNGCYVNGERLLMHIWTVVRFSYRNFFASPKKSPWIFIAFYFHRVYCIYGPKSHSLQIGVFLE